MQVTSLDHPWFQPQVGQAGLCGHHILSYILSTFSSSVQTLCVLSCNQGTLLEPFDTLLRRFQVDQALDSPIIWWFCCFLFPDSLSLPPHSFFLGSSQRNYLHHTLVSGSASRKTRTKTYPFSLIECFCYLFISAHIFYLILWERLMLYFIIWIYCNLTSHLWIDMWGISNYNVMKSFYKSLSTLKQIYLSGNFQK